ncbi:hypothetical protein [Paucidesulfovibrio longus]|uniref:hypothetical protein n=1 Tax=Paucidesulfovibrio longus TaxID=889 RepID=UPI0003B57FEA|nr:hypothetical protein [Paucidesulfovibrio longus]
MRIDGTNLNHVMLQNRSRNSGSSLSGTSAGSVSGVVPRIATATPGQGESETFANEIARRAGAYLDGNGQPKDASTLSAGLTDAMDWLRENFGDDVATAAEGMVLGGTAGGITEENLGNSLTNVLKMVDRNFGIAAGDSAIARFNGGLNDSINGFFDNGRDELFLAVPSKNASGLSQSAVLGDLTDRVLSSSGASDAPSGMEQLLDSLKADLDEALQKAQESSNADSGFSPKARTSQALNGYAAASGLSADSGPALLSMSV